MIPVNSALGRFLVPAFIRFGVSANAITISSLLSGLLGCWLLSQGRPAGIVAGAAAFLWSNVLDECDGRVARQTQSCSRLGALLDTVTDCMVHIAFFLGLGIGWGRLFPHGPWLLLGAVAAGGSFLSCLLDLGGITPRKAAANSQGERRDSLAWVTEWFRIDFSLAVLISAFLRQMAWILWSGALGVFLFWIPSTFLIALRGRGK